MRRACAILAMAALTVTAAPIFAQRGGGLAALEKQLERLMDNEQFEAALPVAQRLDAATVARYGARDPDAARSAAFVAQVYRGLGRFAESEELYKRSLATMEAATGPESKNTATVLNNMAIMYDHFGRYAEAERLQSRAASIYERILPPDSPFLLNAYNSLANNLKNLGRYAEAEKLHAKVLAARERTLGANHTDVAEALDSLGGLYLDQDRTNEALELKRRAVAIFERARGPNHKDVAQALNNLALAYKQLGQSQEAEALLKRSLSIEERVFGPTSQRLSSTLTNLGNVTQSLKRHEESERYFKRALTISETVYGSESPTVAGLLNNLGTAYMKLDRPADAEAAFLRARGIAEKAFGPEHIEVAHPTHNLGNLYEEQKKLAEAQDEFKRAFSIRQRVLGPQHRETLELMSRLAAITALRGNAAEGLAAAREVTKSVISLALAEGAGKRDTTDRAVGQSAGHFRRHVNRLADVARAGGDRAQLGLEAFEMAQWASQSSAASAVRQLGQRFASGGGELGELVRERQDLVALLDGRDKALVDALSTASAQQSVLTESIRRQIEEARRRLTAVTARIDAGFPQFSALASPKPLTAKDVQGELKADEALVFWLMTDDESYVFALSREQFDWRAIPLGSDALEMKVATFRRGLDVDQLQASIKAGKPEVFDLALAHDLHEALLRPVSGVLAGKKHLIVVPTGALTALPAHLLVTDPPPAAGDDLAAYRRAAWLLRRHAVTVLPSVESLKVLRAAARKISASKPMIGFGDPVFNDTQSATATRSASRSVTRAYAEFWRGSGVDRAQLGAALPRLADTADELKAVASKLGAPADDVVLGAAATETEVKRRSLGDYRVVYFATHGLVAGDVKGLGEPSLVLSIPRQATTLDDGLLTASEVAQLKLDADWVVLSACNTISGDKPGAEALSGLTRAFFYAGARALLVSHWAVASDAATRLTTSTFDLIKAEPGISRAEALQRAMLAYMDDASEPKNAYPAFWAPFSIVGDGGSR